MTETDSGITESYNEMGKEVGTNTNNDDITRGYKLMVIMLELEIMIV